MILAELTFVRSPSAAPEAARRAVQTVLAALLHNGQILGRDYGIVSSRGAFRSTVRLPEQNALHARHHGGGVRCALENLPKAGLRPPRVRLLGVELESLPVDACPVPKDLVLYPDPASLESPLRCLEHLHPIPLYRFRALRGEAASAALYWARESHACDSLRSLGGAGDRWGNRQRTHPRSELNRHGRRVALGIEHLTGIATYTFVHRAESAPLPGRKADRCPLCDRRWRLPRPLHEIVTRQCVPCRLLAGDAGLGV